MSICGADLEHRGLYEVRAFGLGFEIKLIPVPTSLYLKVLEEGISHHVTPLWCAAVSGRLAVVKVHPSDCHMFLEKDLGLVNTLPIHATSHSQNDISRQVGLGCFTLEGSVAARRRRRRCVRLWLDADPVRLLHRAPRD